MIKYIAQHLSAGSRHKLFFVASQNNDINFADIGFLLSKAIENNLDKKHLSIFADEILEKLIKDNVVLNPEIGKYVAIRNIGILFEPELKLDLKAKFDSWSKSYILIVDAKEGMIINNTFYLASAQNPSYSINLSEISHKTIYNEI
ncbi:MAG: hypothetical protein SOR57_09795 [Parabacteroides sp.]|nr:hypothetical protein [Parabacteroides sp.]